MSAGRCPKCGGSLAGPDPHACTRLAQTSVDRPKRKGEDSAPSVPPPSATPRPETPTVTGAGRDRYPAEALLDDDADDPRIGTLLGEHYRVLEKLGAGGMGTVYLVIHVHLKKKFAAKLLHPESADRPEAIARFQKEAVSASRLDHDNIVDVVNFGTSSDGTVYLIMEYLRGRPLAEMMTRGVLPLEDVARILVPVCRGLGAAHRAGIVHRDLKPENVFVGRREAGNSIKILDFGVSKIKEGHFQERRLTQSGDVLGSPLYMSPEAAKGELDVDGRADLYAVGVMLYEMCVGQVPFHADNYLQVLYQHISEKPRPPRTHRAELPEAVEKVILRALAKDPADRFQTADELAEALLAAFPGVDLAAPLSASGAGGPLPMSGLTPTPRPAMMATPRPPAHTPQPARPSSSTPRLPLPAPPAPPPVDQPAARPSRLRIVVLSATAVAIAAVVTVWLVTRGTSQEAVRTVPAPPIVDTRPPASSPPTPPPAVKVAQAELSVDSTPPGAAVILDGEKIGDTPLLVTMPADARVRTLRVELAGFRPDVREIVLDQSRAVAVALHRVGKRPLDIKEGR